MYLFDSGGQIKIWPYNINYENPFNYFTKNKNSLIMTLALYQFCFNNIYMNLSYVLYRIRNFNLD